MKFRNRFFLAASIASLSVLLCTTDIMAQGRGRGGPGGRRGGGGQTSPSQLLRRDDVRQELELTEEQLESLRELGQDRMGGRSREELREEFEGLSQEERREKMQEMRTEREESMKVKMSEILLPFQVERLTQISNQMSARSGANSLTNGALAEKLKITDEQKEKIKEKAEKLQNEFSEKVAEMRAKMQEEILGELSSTQRREYEEMMGDKFEFQDNRGDRGDRGERGDRGGRGDRGRRNRGSRPGRDGGEDA
jgi:hypothetical protein